MPEYKFTDYFENEVLRKRTYLKKEWRIRVIENPIRVEVQSDNRIRFWGKVDVGWWLDLLFDALTQRRYLRFGLRHKRDQTTTNWGAMWHAHKAQVTAQALIFAQELMQFTVTKRARRRRNDCQ
jgi:hypothetical protein